MHEKPCSSLCIEMVSKVNPSQDSELACKAVETRNLAPYSDLTVWVNVCVSASISMVPLSPDVLDLFCSQLFK